MDVIGEIGRWQDVEQLEAYEDLAIVSLEFSLRLFLLSFCYSDVVLVTGPCGIVPLSPVVLLFTHLPL